MKNYIGIDPGKSGGIAIVSADTNLKPFCCKMPETERDIWDLIVSLKDWRDYPSVAVIERVHAMPGQGVTSMFTFGQGYGSLRMALIAAGIPFQEVTPQRWQKDMGCRTGGNKNISKAKAQQLFPLMKITHAHADALLIAEWGRTKNT